MAFPSSSGESPFASTWDRRLGQEASSAPQNTIKSSECGENQSPQTGHSSFAQRRKDFMSKGGFGDEREHRRKRQEEVLARQKSNRRDLTSYARQLALELFDAEESSSISNGAGSAKKNANGKQAGAVIKRYVAHLMQPETICHLPDVPSEWLLRPCPDGDRVLVVASKGRTLIIRKDGTVLKRTQMNLPGGSQHSQSSRSSYTIFDCIYEELIDTLGSRYDGLEEVPLL